MKRIIILALVFLPALIFSQETWVRTYSDGPWHDWANSIIQTSDGDYILAGGTLPLFSDSSGFYVLRIDSSGETIWTEVLNNGNYSEVNSVIQTFDGGFMLAGMVNYNFGVTKIDSDGAIIWAEVFERDSYAWDIASSVVQTPDSGYAIFGKRGNIDPLSGNTDDFCLIKIDSTGDLLWMKTYGDSLTDFGTSMAKTYDNGFIMAGWTNSFSDNTDIYVIRADSSGDTLWTRTYGTPGNDQANCIIQTSDSGFVIAGYTDYYGTSQNTYIVKINGSGDVIWTKYFDIDDYETPSSIIQTSDNGFALLINTSDASHLLKLDNSGDSLWIRELLLGDFVKTNSIIQISDGGFVIAGEIAYELPDSTDVLVIKTDEYGYVSWIADATRVPNNIHIFAYPNPFNSSVVITVSGGRGLASQTPTNIAIYDIMGNVVYAPSSVPSSSGHLLPEGEGQMPPSPTGRGTEGEGIKSTFIWTPDKTIASGIYLVRATTQDGQTITKRIVYLK